MIGDNASGSMARLDKFSDSLSYSFFGIYIGLYGCLFYTFSFVELAT